VTNTAAPKKSWGTWLLVLLLAASTGLAALGWRRTLALQAELRDAQQTASTLDQRATTAEKQARLVRTLEDEVARLQRQTDELHQLRGQFQELQQLRAERDKLQQQNQQLQQSQQTLSSSLRQAQVQAQVQAQQATSPAPVSWIGIAMNPASTGGVEVESVVPGGPAAASGLEPGDLVVAVDGQPVADAAALRELVGKKAVGQPVVLDVQREGNPFRVALKTGAFPR
jgi:C-terminal processing protease CtpA/Prc